MLYSDCQTEDLFTLVNLHCCIQDHYSAYSLMVYRWQSRLHVVLVEHHPYTSCLALYMKSCYSCTGTQYWLLLVIDHYCFVSELLSVSLVTQELTAVSEKWLDIGQELGVEQSSLEDSLTYCSDPGDCLREVLSMWLRNCATTTWGDIIAVLRSPRIGDFQLADNLEAKYYLSESLQIKFIITQTMYLRQTCMAVEIKLYI